MTDVSAVQPKPPLGVGRLLGDSFSILFSKFVQVIAVAFLPSLIGLLISGALTGFNVVLGLSEPEFNSAGSGIAFVLSMLVDIVVYTLTTALLIQLAYDAKLNRPVQIGRYFGPALAAIVPLAILSIVVGILAGIGIVLLIVPGLWVYAVFSVIAPAIVIERVGFGGLGRSAALTKEYRWPIVGAIILAFICAILINTVALLLVGLVSSFGGIILAAVIFVAFSTIAAGLISILVALIYARLREIKEGVNVDQIAAVFE
ncbi:hypothetical protein [Roseibium sp. MMSF_3544]|uniref:hypothetical protein n=1 Tax=unclassified Roseibium TaxID=2629323 RepID=UPI00273D453F|nr:hypothetical protein [Roseibium sp. MMSF_3544]